jgi:hypothetical protein
MSGSSSAVAASDRTAAVRSGSRALRGDRFCQGRCSSIEPPADYAALMSSDLDPPPTPDELVELLHKLTHEELEQVAAIVRRLLDEHRDDAPQPSS